MSNAGKETIGATSSGFNDQVEVTYGLNGEVQLQVNERSKDGDKQRTSVCWMTPKETEDLITVLQYALSLMEDKP